MAPITMVFIITGLAVFTQAMFFLGIGASAEEGKKSPDCPSWLHFCHSRNRQPGRWYFMLPWCDRWTLIRRCCLLVSSGSTVCSSSPWDLRKFSTWTFGLSATSPSQPQSFRCSGLTSSRVAPTWTLILIWWVVTFLAITLDHVREAASTRLGDHLDAHRALHLLPRSSRRRHGLGPALIAERLRLCLVLSAFAQSEAFRLTEANVLADHRMYLPKSCYL